MVPTASCCLTVRVVATLAGILLSREASVNVLGDFVDPIYIAFLIGLCTIRVTKGQMGVALWVHACALLVMEACIAMKK